MRRISMCLCVWLASAWGCAAPARWPEPEQAAARATGIEGAIELRLEGEPTDVADAPTGELTMAEAIRRTLRHDPAIQVALARVQSAAADSHQARLLPNPIVSVVLRWAEGGGSPTVEAGIAADLLSLLRKPGEIDVADKRLRAESERVLIAVLDAVAETQRRFVEIQSLEAASAVLDERARLLDRLIALARQRLDAGEGTRLDLTTLEAERIDLEVEIAEQQVDRRAARLALARLLGEPSGAADWALQRWALPEAEGVDESRWIAAALEHRPELAALVWEIEATGAEVRLTRWAPLDPLEVGVEAEREEGDWSVGPSVTVPLPLFDWGQAKRERAEAARREALHELTAQRRRVVEEVRVAHQSHARLFGAYASVRDRLIPLLERRLGEAESAFRAGHSDSTPLILAEQDLQQGRARLIDLERRAAESLIDLHRAVGGAAMSPDTQTLPTTPDHDQTIDEEPS